MWKKVATFLLALLLIASISVSLSIYSENLSLRKQVLNLREEIRTLKSANLTTALGIIEIPPSSQNTIWGNNFSYVWITGWVYNYGASAAIDAGLQLLAKNETKILLNESVPLVSYGLFSTNQNKTLIPDFLTPTPYEIENVLSQQNATVRIAIYNEGIFSNNTTFQIIPFGQTSHNYFLSNALQTS